jgi:pimeloyl-ACP methyl ester carboxylesterase
MSDVVGQMVDRMGRDWPRFARSSVDRMVGDRVSEEQKRFFTDLLTATPLATASRTLLDVATQDPVTWVDGFGVPVLFVHGNDDAISPLEGVQGLAAAMGQAEVQVYDGIGHAPPVEDPERLSQDIERFVEGLT